MRACRVQSATVILVWLLLVGGALSLPSPALLLASAAFLSMAFAAAYRQVRRILFRSRWLIASLIGLFVWLTPGTTIPWTGGATFEGAWFAADQLGRLLLSIAAVALLLRTLDGAQLVAGLRGIGAPLAILGIDRDRLAVRLALTLDRIERGEAGSLRVVAALRGGQPDDAPVGETIERIEISGSRLGPPDLAAILCTAAIVAGGRALV